MNRLSINFIGPNLAAKILARVKKRKMLQLLNNDTTGFIFTSAKIMLSYHTKTQNLNISYQDITDDELLTELGTKDFKKILRNILTQPTSIGRQTA